MLSRRQEIREFIENRGIIAVLLVLREIFLDKVADSRRYQTPLSLHWEPFWRTGVKRANELLDLYKEKSKGI